MNRTNWRVKIPQNEFLSLKVTSGAVFWMFSVMTLKWKVVFCIFTVHEKVKLPTTHLLNHEYSFNYIKLQFLAHFTSFDCSVKCSFSNEKTCSHRFWPKQLLAKVWNIFYRKKSTLTIRQILKLEESQEIRRNCEFWLRNDQQRWKKR